VATEVIHQVAKVHSKYWKSIDPVSCEPPEGEFPLIDVTNLANWSVTEIDNKPATLSIPDLLKIHRAHHMFEKHRMFQIPLASEELESAFGGQVICK
jgi:histone deacetylase 6